MRFERVVRFQDLGFRYTASSRWVIRDVNVEIRKGARVGIVGPTGSGKSTMLDLLMGLLRPSVGRIEIDGQDLTMSNRRAWQRIIAHVPQQVFLTDATLAENVAFGIPAERIDMKLVDWACKQAQLADFVKREADGYKTVVGERGVRLSGGQRQRIGIARALYKQAEVLVLDEATSALNEAVEQRVMEGIEGLGRAITVIVVAHRSSALRYCDEIMELEQSRLVVKYSPGRISRAREKMGATVGKD